jgi:hypothetical protein
MKALDFLTAPETDDSGDDSAPPKIKALDFLNAKPAADALAAPPLKFDALKLAQPQQFPPNEYYDESATMADRLEGRGGSNENAANVFKAVGSTANKALDYTGNVARGFVTDIVNQVSLGDGYAENLDKALRGGEMPVDVENRELAKTHPGLAAAAMTAQGGLKTAPLLLAGGLPALEQRAVALGFSAQMVAGVGKLASEYGDELGKNPEDRNPGKLAQLRSDLIQTGVFAPLAGAHGATGGRKPSPDFQGPLATGRVLRTPAGAQPPESPAATVTPPAPPSEPATTPEAVIPAASAPLVPPDAAASPDIHGGALEDLTPDQQAQSNSVKAKMAAEVAKVKSAQKPAAPAQAGMARLVKFDDLHPTVKEDIAANLKEKVPFLRDDSTIEESDVLANLDGLVDEPVLKVSQMPISQIEGFNRKPSKVAVKKFRGMLEQTEAPPIIVSGNKFIDGGHRLKAYIDSGRTHIPVVDIEPLLSLDWEKYTADKIPSPKATLEPAAKPQEAYNSMLDYFAKSKPNKGDLRGLIFAGKQIGLSESEVASQLAERSKQPSPSPVAAKAETPSQPEGEGKIGTPKPGEIEPKPVQPKVVQSPIEVLNTAKQVKIVAPKGATMIRATTPDGKVSVQALSNVQGENIFRGANISKIEAGTIGKDKKFVPMEGEVTIEPKQSRADAIAEFPKGQVSRGPGAAAGGEPGTYSAIQQLADRIEATGKSDAPVDQKISAIEKVKVKASEIGDSVKSALANVLAIRKAMWDSYAQLAPYTEMKAIVGRWYYAVQRADFEAREFGKQILKAVPDKARREAITNWIQADGDEAVLKERAAASKPQYKRGYELAQKLTPREVEIAQMLREYYDRQLEKGISEGLLKDGLENYITQVWKKENPITRKLMNDLVNSKLQPNFKYARKRIFDSYFEGEQAGFKPMKDAGALVANYDQTFNKALAARAFIKDLHEGKASDGRPLVEIAGRIDPVDPNAPKPKIIIKPKATPEEIGDYRTIDHPALRGWKWLGKTPDGADVLMQGELKVHPEIYAKLRNRLSTSWFRQNPAARGILNVQSTLKQSMMSISGFHQVQENLHALGHRINPTNLEKLDFSDPVTKSLVEHGLQLADHNALEQFGEGLSSGKLLNKIPVTGAKMQQYNDWLFQEDIPRLKLTMAKHALARNMERYADAIKAGKITPDQVLELTASQANHAFGELPYKYWGRNPNLQDAYRTFLLAPDFLEARGGFVGQALKPQGLGAKGLLKNEQVQALALLALSQYMIARITNQIISGDPHWEWKNAFRIIVGNHAYSLRTVPGDIIHLVSDPRGFISNRLSPVIGRGGLELATSRDYRGVKRDFMGQMKDVLESGIPISMRIQNGSKILESFSNAFGVQNQRYDAVQNIQQRIADWKSKQGIKTPYETVYDPAADVYNGLRNAIDSGDKSGAVKEYQKLSQKITPAKIQQHFKESLSRPLTGSKAHDDAFFNSLDDVGKSEFREALNLRNARLAAVSSLTGNSQSYQTKLP